MNATTDHPRARIVALTLGELSVSLLTDWKPGYGIPEVLNAVTAQDTFTRILCERVLQDSGVDVFWNDLVCSTKEQAASAVMAVAEAGVDLHAHYGPNYDAIVGILQGAVLMDSARIASLGYQLTGGGFSRDYDTALLYAREAGVEPMLDRILSDIQVACHKREIQTPSALQRHLLGVRAIELTVCYYVLKGANVDMPEAFELRLTEPMRAYLFPNAPRL